MTGSPALIDPAAQAERTQLAWTRTALAVAVVAALLLRLAATSGRVPLVVAGVVLLAAAAAVQVGARRRYRGLLADVPAGRPVAARGAAALVTAVVLVLCLLSVVSVAAGWPSGAPFRP